MSTALLDPEPFRKWYADQKEHHEAEEIARWFGIDSRTLRRWDDPKLRIRRSDLEAALMGSEFVLWDIYPELEERGVATLPKGNLPGQGCLISDQQLRILHAIHTDRRVSIKRLGQELWEQFGYASAISAERAIGRGFHRLGLKAVAHHRETFGLRRCGGLNRLAERCVNPPLAGEDYCYAHHPKTRNKLILHALTVSPFVKEYA